MKKRLLSILLMCCMVLTLLPTAVFAEGETDVSINETNFPDANFRTVVKEYDTDKDENLSRAEIEAVKEIKCYYRDIRSLTGIEYFTALQTLECYSNQLTSLDISGNTALKSLDCAKNQLAALDVSQNTALESLDCADNQLTTLDVSRNTALKSLDCAKNQLTTLDVSRNTALESLNCADNQVTSLDISQNTALESLICAGNKLTALNVSGNATLKFLNCESNELTALDVNRNTALNTLNCLNNRLTSLNVSLNLNLQDLNCAKNKLAALDVQKNTALKSLYCGYNQLTVLDVGQNRSLESLSCNNNLLTSLNVSQNTRLNLLLCFNNHLTSLDTSNQKWLHTLSCNNNNYPITITNDRNYDLSDLPGTFDVNKASNWSGGTVSGNILTVDHDKDGVTYTYDCGNGKTANFTLTVENKVEEQFTLTPGGRYYFDLSAMNIPGTANRDLPDSTLHYVPFTYVGTVDAYKLTSAMATTEEHAQQNKYPHSLFIADYNVTFNVDWNQLNEKQMIFGTPYTSYGVNYTMRAPSAGSQSNNGTDDSSTRGIPKSNEWDAILDKANQDWKDNTSGYIKNWSGKYSFGQDNYANAYRAYRGYFSARFWGWSSASTRHPDLGFRPVLELPTGLAADNLKVVELRTVKFMPGEQQNWINIIVKNGERFTAPSAEGLPRPNDVSPDTPMWWTDGNGNYYKPGSTVPADVSMIYPLWGGFGLLLDRGDGAVEVTPDNYTDIFGDGSASFVLPKGETFDDLINYYQLNEAARHKIYSTGKYGENIFPNLKLKNAELTSVTLNRRYIEQVSPFFITLDGKNTIGSLSGVRGRSMTLSILGGGALALNSISDFGIYAQNDVSVTIADALNVGRLYMFSGSLTVTDDTQAVTLGDTFDGYYPLNVRVFAGNSAQDAVEVTGWQLSPEMLALYQRFYAGETLTNDENSTLKKAIKDQWDVIRTKLSGKPYARFTQAWDVTYQPGTNGKGDGVTDVKFYGDALTLRDKLFTRSGYTQVGWATADGGEKIYDLSGVYTTDAALTLYPVWTRSSSGGSSGSSSPSYAVTVPDKTEHGTVTANRRYAEKGDTVTITVTPDSGYVLETITATDKNGNDLKLTNKGNGKYTFTMPGSKVEVEATFMEDNSVLNFFYDVPNDAYYYEAVKWAAEKGVTSGIGNSLFAPNQPCTRAQIVTFLWRAAGSPVVNYLMPFTDVDEGVYYAEAVRWAASTGIVTGLTETSFDPNGACTRAQAAAMIYRHAQAQGKGFTGAWMFLLPFTDVPEWAYESVAWCYMNGVTTGVSETSFAPGNDCTRAQIVTFLWRCKK